MQRWLLLLMLAGCGDGSRGGSLAAPIVPPPSDGVDKGEAIDLGSGVDDGDGTLHSTAEFATCRVDGDCARGVCTARGEREGVCIAICAQPPGDGFERLPIESCVGREQCVRTDGAGVCLVACSGSADCPPLMECNRLDPSLPANFCVPIFTTSEPEPPPG